MIIAHVGDSRAYSIDSQGKIEALTRDHSLVKRLVELGQISREEAAIHPQRNVLYRALGQGEPFDPDIKRMQIPENGYLLICSDGLWGVVPEEEIAKVIITSATPDLACQALIDAANAAGGPDNITAILIQLPG
jgi:protein phosphatase